MALVHSLSVRIKVSVIAPQVSVVVLRSSLVEWLTIKPWAVMEQEALALEVIAAHSRFKQMSALSSTQPSPRVLVMAFVLSSASHVSVTMDGMDTIASMLLVQLVVLGLMKQSLQVKHTNWLNAVQWDTVIVSQVSVIVVKDTLVQLVNIWIVHMTQSLVSPVQAMVGVFLSQNIFNSPLVVSISMDWQVH
jgi:hypothetical protein